MQVHTWSAKQSNNFCVYLITPSAARLAYVALEPHMFDGRVRDIIIVRYLFQGKSDFYVCR